MSAIPSSGLRRLNCLPLWRLASKSSIIAVIALQDEIGFPTAIEHLKRYIKTRIHEFPDVPIDVLQLYSVSIPIDDEAPVQSFIKNVEEHKNRSYILSNSRLIQDLFPVQPDIANYHILVDLPDRDEHNHSLALPRMTQDHRHIATAENALKLWCLLTRAGAPPTTRNDAFAISIAANADVDQLKQVIRKRNQPILAPIIDSKLMLFDVSSLSIMLNDVFDERLVGEDKKSALSPGIRMGDLFTVQPDPMNYHIFVDYIHYPPFKLWCILKLPDAARSHVFCISVNGDANVDQLKQAVRQRHLPLLGPLIDIKLRLFDVSSLSIMIDDTFNERFSKIDLSGMQDLNPADDLSKIFGSVNDKQLHVVVRLPSPREPKLEFNLNLWCILRLPGGIPTRNDAFSISIEENANVDHLKQLIRERNMPLLGTLADNRLVLFDVSSLSIMINDTFDERLTEENKQDSLSPNTRIGDLFPIQPDLGNYHILVDIPGYWIPGPTLRIWCILSRPNPTRNDAFVIRISASSNVDQLKQYIKDRNMPALDRFVESELMVFDVSSLSILMDNTFDEYIRTIDLGSMQCLNPRQYMSSLFGSVDDNQLHVIVRLPSKELVL